MNRVVPCILVVLLVAACGGGGNTQVHEAPPFKSRLTSFDAAALDTGLQLPDFTRYWELAESRNGNAFPIKAGVDDDTVLCGGLDKAGFSVREGGKLIPAGLPALLSALDTLARNHWNEKEKSSAAALVLFADKGARFGALCQLCLELVNLGVANLWLVTADRRDGSSRLLPLLVDVRQLGNDWYTLEDSRMKSTLRLTWTRDVKGEVAGLDWPLAQGYDLGPNAPARQGWKDALDASAAAASQQCTRVQFDLPQEATVAEFAELVSHVAAAGFAEVEPFWPALQRPEASNAKEVRKLAEFKDDLGCTEGLSLPTLSHWWRASAADRGLAPAVALDETRPLLALRVTADGAIASRERGGEWARHAADAEVMEALRRLSGEIDMDTGVSELEVVLAMDRASTWVTFLGVLQMLRTVGVSRLFVASWDQHGPVLRLLDAGLPTGALPHENDTASVIVQREGAVAEGKYTVTMKLDGAEHKVTGPRYSRMLAEWAGDRERDPLMLGISLPLDEPFETLFTVLNAVAWLGMPALAFGG